jgi:hypothetical protein
VTKIPSESLTNPTIGKGCAGVLVTTTWLGAGVLPAKAVEEPETIGETFLFHLNCPFFVLGFLLSPVWAQKGTKIAHGNKNSFEGSASPRGRKQVTSSQPQLIPSGDSS